MDDRIIRKFNAWKKPLVTCDSCGSINFDLAEVCSACGADFITMHSLIIKKSDSYEFRNKHFTASFERHQNSADRSSHSNHLQKFYERGKVEGTIRDQKALQGENT